MLEHKLWAYLHVIIFILGIVFSNGVSWKAIRRFILSTLRDFGMGKKTIEAKIQDELIPLIENFKSHNGNKSY